MRVVREALINMSSASLGLSGLNLATAALPIAGAKGLFQHLAHRAAGQLFNDIHRFWCLDATELLFAQRDQLAFAEGCVGF